MPILILPPSFSHTEMRQGRAILTSMSSASTAAACLGLQISRMWHSLGKSIPFDLRVSFRLAGLLNEKEDHYRFAVGIGAVMLTLGLANAFTVSILFAPLVLGIATRGFEHKNANLSQVGLGEGGDLFYIILFVMAGAKINLSAIASTASTAALLMVGRSVSIFAAIFLIGRLIDWNARKSFALSLPLLPMAGMAIGLTVTTSKFNSEIGDQVATIIYPLVALFETIGPFAVVYAFHLSGEAKKL